MKIQHSYCINISRSLISLVALLIFVSISGCSSKDAATESLNKLGVSVTADSLSFYAGRGELETVKLLIDAGVGAGVPNSKGSLALVDSAWAGKKDVVTYFLDAKVDVNTVGSTKVTALGAAAANSQEPVVLLLLERGANPNLVDGNGASPLINAAWLGSANSVKALLAHGAQVDYRRASDGMTALKAALAAKHSDVAEVLKAAGATD